MEYIEITTKSALHKIGKKQVPYSYDLNIYRGCSHQCQYCYALYSHKYMEADNEFFNKVFIKTNIVENLDRELSSKRWKPNIINLGGVCDSYQPIEIKYELMRGVLKTLIKYKNPFTISTKSDLILRDLDLLEQLADLTYTNVALTITTLDEKIRKKIEPFSVDSDRRFKVLEKLKDTKISTGLHIMPTLPFITATKDNLDRLLARAKECKVDYVLVSGLNLRGPTRPHFLNFVKSEFPQRYQNYLKLYNNKEIKRKYSERLHSLVKELKKKHSITGNFTRPIKENLVNRKQSKLFDY